MWACIGDFNEVRDQSEKLGGRKVNSINNFFLNNFLDNVNGVDIGFSGNSFTWCNRKGGLANIRERLDRVVSSIEWRTKFDNSGVIHLNALRSDHAPILLNLYLDHPNLPKPFRFQEIWTRDPSCGNVIKRAWECNNSNVDRISIGKRIINTARTLSKWNKESFGFCKNRICDLEDKINRLQSIQPTEDVLNEERALQEEISEWISRQEML